MNREKLRTTAKKEVELRRFYTKEVAPLLKKWIKEIDKKDICPICGEDMPETFHKHHIDGDRHNNSIDNLVYICGSCHVLTYKAKTKLRELWNKRHEKLGKPKILKTLKP